jgi:hypothetical protein
MMHVMADGYIYEAEMKKEMRPFHAIFRASCRSPHFLSLRHILIIRLGFSIGALYVSVTPAAIAPHSSNHHGDLRCTIVYLNLSIDKQTGGGEQACIDNDLMAMAYHDINHLLFKLQELLRSARSQRLNSLSGDSDKISKGFVALRTGV